MNLPHISGSAESSNLAFRSLLENLLAAAYTCDADGLITYFHQHAVQIWAATRI